MKSIHHSDSGNTDSENHLFGHGVLENQIQAPSRTIKDFPGLENLEKNSRTSKDPQEPWRDDCRES